MHSPFKTPLSSLKTPLTKITPRQLDTTYTNTFQMTFNDHEIMMRDFIKVFNRFNVGGCKSPNVGTLNRALHDLKRVIVYRYTIRVIFKFANQMVSYYTTNKHMTIFSVIKLMPKKRFKKLCPKKVSSTQTWATVIYPSTRTYMRSLVRKIL